MFIYPIYNHNWRNIISIYIYITILASNEISSPSNKIHPKVGRAKDLSAPMCDVLVDVDSRAAAFPEGKPYVR